MVVVLLLLASAAVAAFYLAYRGKILPGVSLNSLPLENRTVSITVPLVEKYLSVYQHQKLPLQLNEQVVLLTPSEVGFIYDARQTCELAYRVGRTGSLAKRLREAYLAYRYGIDLLPPYQLEVSRLSSYVQALASRYDQPPRDAGFILQNGRLEVTSSQNGLMVEQSSLKLAITSSLANLEFRPLPVEMVLVEPTVSSVALLNFKEGVAELMRTPIQFAYQEQLWTPSPEEILSFLKVGPSELGDSLKLGINQQSVEEYLQKIKPAIEVTADAGVFELNNDRVVKFAFPRDGVTVDVAATSALLHQTISGERGALVIDIAVIITKAPGLANDYGIRDLLGEGVTQYRGSIAGRVHNIGLASQRVRGVLVPPGEVFSFNANVGEITAATGYDQAYIISERKTVLGTGGGVCQVSTTLYKAALAAGLEIVQRYPHSYRVSYYEPAGMDATVYAPSVDLQFKNNSAHHLLIDSEFKPEAWELIFRIYGTDDGREVQIIGPTVTVGGAPPEPIYQEDPSLAPGQVKQVDFAAWGAKAYFERIVTRGEEVLIEETVHTSYSPWQAVFLVGPQE